MLDSLIRHEQTHRLHAMVAGEATASGLAALPAQIDCRTMGREAQRVLRAAVAASRRLSIQYDRDTRFGATDGVSLDGADASRTLAPIRAIVR